MQIFLPRRESAADMPFLFVYVEYFARLGSERRVELAETFRHVFVYRTFADSEFFCGVAHGGAVVNDIVCYVKYPLFYVILQGKIPREACFYSVCRGRKGYESGKVG